MPNLDTFFPFPSQTVTDDQWRSMARLWSPSGVVRGQANEMAVWSNGTDASRGVRVKTGACFAYGVYGEITAEKTLNLTAAASTRVDRIVARMSGGSTRTLSVEYVTGSSPTVPPALTQNSSTWEIPLAQVQVLAGATTIPAGSFIDERQFIGQTAAPTAARVTISGSQNITAITFTPIAFDVETYDQGNCFSTSTYRYTAPMGGVYRVAATVRANLPNGSPQCEFFLEIFKNNGSFSRGVNIVQNPVAWASFTIGAEVYDEVPMLANDYVDIRAYCTTAAVVQGNSVYNGLTHVSVSRITG